MAAAILTFEPHQFIAGDTARWTRALADYSAADGWTLAYEFRGPSALTVDATTDTGGIGFAITVPATESAKLDAGLYRWYARVARGGEVWTVGQGTVIVEQNPSSAQAGDLQSDAEKDLVKVRVQIQQLLDTPIDSYSIGQRDAQRRKLEELTTLRGVLISKIGQQRNLPYPTHRVVFR